MTKKQIVTGIKNIDNLANAIQHTNEYFLNRVQKQVDIALTLRNWIIGYYIVEYEQRGEDRAAYGKKLYKEIADRIVSRGIKSIVSGIYIYVKIYTRHILKFCGQRQQNRI